MWIDDQILENCHKDLELKIFVPDETLVVLGNGNQSEKECHLDHCEEDGVPVLKRYGGGGAVVLHDGCLVVSLGLWMKDYFKNDSYFCAINKALISSMASFHPLLGEVYQDGISDLCFEGKKVAGTSLFRSRNYLLYQASLLWNPRISLLERYLKHPSKEPEYRKKKSHRDFVTGLQTILRGGDLREFKNSVQKSYKQNILNQLSSELIPHQESQKAHLLKKSKSSSHPHLF